MLRCVASSVVVAAVLSTALPAVAQTSILQNRTFPSNALRGEMVILQPPEMLLNGRPARLAPGARIRDENNLLQLSGALIGRRLIIHYTHDAAGQPMQVWVLTAGEYARKPWPVNDAQAQTWFFDPAAQQWTVR